RTSKTYGGLLSAVLVAGLAFAPAAVAQQCDSCGKGPCPPYYKYHYEGPPKIKFKCGCPRPICDPCNLPHYGYFPTCWHPWPFPRNECPCHHPQPDVLLPYGDNTGMPHRLAPSDATSPPRSLAPVPPAS